MTCSNGWTTLMQHRCLVTLMNLAARKGAKAGLAERVLAYLEAGDKADAEDTRWKALQYEFLVALDRPKDLAKRLQAWIAAGDADNGWRLILGYLEAEIGPDPRRHPPFRGGPRGRRARTAPTTARWPIGTWRSIAARPTIGPASRPSR